MKLNRSKLGEEASKDDVDDQKMEFESSNLVVAGNVHDLLKLVAF